MTNSSTEKIIGSREFIEISDWESFQYSGSHRKPDPPWKWFRLHCSFIESPIWFSMTKPQRADFVTLLNLASRTGNMIPKDAKWLSRHGVSTKTLPSLVELSLIRDFSLPANDKRVRQLRSILSGGTPSRAEESRADENKTEKRESKEDNSLSESSSKEPPKRIPPPDFKITDSLHKWAATNYPSVESEKETAKFLRHEFSTPRSNWDEAWKTWIQRASEYQESHNGSSHQPSHNEQLLKLGNELGMYKRDDESDAQFCSRVDEANNRRIDYLGL